MKIAFNWGILKRIKSCQINGQKSQADGRWIGANVNV